jgi:uncharacterized OB-fold protein
MATARRDAPSAPYFDALARHELVVPRCAACGTWLPPAGLFAGPPVRCASCQSDQLEWTVVAGAGTLVTWTAIPRRASVVDGGEGQVAGLVELVEGPWITAAIDAPPDRLAEGLPVQFDTATPGEGSEPVPLFRAAPA